MNSFSISEVLSFGWETFKKNVSFFIILVVIIFGVQFVVSIFTASFDDSSLGKFVVYVLGAVVSLVVSVGITKITLDFVDGKKGDFKDLYQQYPLLLNYIGASILGGLIVLVGFILFIVPGIYLSVKLCFTSYAVVDKKLGPVEALKASYNMTKGNWWNLALLGIVSVLIVIAGALALLVGLFVAIPVVMLAFAYAYRKLSSDMGSAAAPAAPEPAVPVSTPEPTPAVPQT